MSKQIYDKGNLIRIYKSCTYKIYAQWDMKIEKKLKGKKKSRSQIVPLYMERVIYSNNDKVIKTNILILKA